MEWRSLESRLHNETTVDILLCENIKSKSFLPDYLTDQLSYVTDPSICRFKNLSLNLVLFSYISLLTFLNFFLTYFLNLSNFNSSGTAFPSYLYSIIYFTNNFLFQVTVLAPFSFPKFQCFIYFSNLFKKIFFKFFYIWFSYFNSSKFFICF